MRIKNKIPLNIFTTQVLQKFYIILSPIVLTENFELICYICLFLKFGF